MEIMNPEPLTNWLLFFLAISGVITLVARWIVKGAKAREKHANEQREELVQLIKETTKQIQPNANGGKSLSDLHAKVDEVKREYERAKEAEDVQRKLWHERYLADQNRIRREWTAVFIAIRKMIHLPPEQQAAMWDSITEDYINGTIGDKYPDERKN